MSAIARNPIPSVAPPRAGGVTILVVDDSPLCREVTSAALRAQGFLVAEAEDGLAALAVMKRRRVDLLILEHEMPRMTGLALLKTLRADPRGAALPVLMLTSATSKEVVVEAMKLGVRGYLLKNRSSVPEIVTRVRAVLLGVDPAPVPTPMPPSRSSPSPTSQRTNRPKPGGLEGQDCQR